MNLAKWIWQNTYRISQGVRCNLERKCKRKSYVREHPLGRMEVEIKRMTWEWIIRTRPQGVNVLNKHSLGRTGCFGRAGLQRENVCANVKLNTVGQKSGEMFTGRWTTEVKTKIKSLFNVIQKLKSSKMLTWKDFKSYTLSYTDKLCRKLRTSSSRSLF